MYERVIFCGLHAAAQPASFSFRGLHIQMPFHQSHERRLPPCLRLSRHEYRKEMLWDTINSAV